MHKNQERVRFAPSPTGWLHLGSVRAALFNKLYALKTNGTFILRVEDTDQSRDVDPGAVKIQEDLQWLGISFDEGPYFQSQRTALYQKYLDQLIANNQVYRCFDTPEELETRRQIQIARGLPPKYDRACLKLSQEEVAQKLAQNTPFIWRLRLPETTISFLEVTRGEMSFDLTHFSDFALTRQDGSFTFLFANFVDDLEMGITMVIRGEDHLSNSASQVALYKAFNKPCPRFFHLPLVCSVEGKKLSKRDFGFSLNDLKEAGYLPQAICNYVALLGHSFEEEILSLEELARAIPFDTNSPKSSVRYDADKLLWINHKWIQRLLPEDFVAYTLPFLTTAYPKIIDNQHLRLLIEKIRPNMQTLKDAQALLRFFYHAPQTFSQELVAKHNFPALATALETLASVSDEDAFFATTKTSCSKELKKDLFALIRVALTAQDEGIGIKDLVEMLSLEEAKKRLRYFIDTVA